MKAIVCILKTYLWHKRALIFLPALAICMFLANIVLSGTKSRLFSWLFFLYAGIILSIAIGYHLSMVIRCSETDLLPRHRQYQLLAAGGIFTIMFLWSTVALPFAAISPWHVIAFYLLCSSIGLWLGYLNFGSKGTFGLDWLGMVILLAMCVDISRSANPTRGVSYVERGLLRVGDLWPLYVVIVSLLSFIFFCHWFLHRYPAMLRPSRQNDNKIFIATGDRANFLSIWMAARMISILAKRKTAPFRLVRLLQFGLFSPMSTASILNVCTNTFLAFLSLWLGKLGRQGLGDFAEIAIPMVCIMTTVLLAFDFISHRTRIPMLYLQSRLPSRRAFADAALYSYLLLAGRQLGFTVLIVAFITAVKFGWQLDNWMNVLQSLLVALPMIFGLITFPLIYGRSLPSPVTILILFAITFILLPTTALFLIFGIWGIVPMIAAAIFLLLYAIRRWRNSEMDAVFESASGT